MHLGVVPSVGNTERAILFYDIVKSFSNGGSLLLWYLRIDLPQIGRPLSWVRHISHECLHYSSISSALPPHFLRLLFHRRSSRCVLSLRRPGKLCLLCSWPSSSLLGFNWATAVCRSNPNSAVLMRSKLEFVEEKGFKGFPTKYRNWTFIWAIRTQFLFNGPIHQIYGPFSFQFDKTTAHIKQSQ